MTTTSADTQTPAVTAEIDPSKKRSRLPFLIGGAAVLALGGGSYFLYSRGYEDTDDAQIDASITNVSARVAGTIKTVLVHDNQAVKEGDVLADLDTADLEVALAYAKAQVAQAEALLVAEDPTVSITETSNEAAEKSAHSDLASAQAAVSGASKDVAQLTAQLAQAEANDKNAQLERERADRLIAQGAIPTAERDTKTALADASRANVEAVKQALAAARDRVLQQSSRIEAVKAHLGEVKANAPLQLEERKANVVMRRANLTLARAQLDQAVLNLAYGKITSPVTGIVGKKSVNVGDHVAPGQQLLAIAQTDQLWVTANFRETQLRKVRPGQAVEVHVDALDIDLNGKVESIGGATGSRFSVLPPENAAGNYVKVVQRIPVRIELTVDDATRASLRPGMSVEPKVRVR